MTADTLVLSTPDGDMQLYEALPDPGATVRGAVLVVQEAFGVNDHIQDVTRRFAAAGYRAVAPAFFHRSGPDSVVDYSDFGPVLEMFQGLGSDDAILTDIDAALAHLRAAGFADDRIGLVGFCFGGRVSFLAAARRRLGAAVGFYGGGIVHGRFPQFPALVDEAPTLQTPWLGLFGDLDGGIPVEDVEALRDALKSASVETDIVRYADAEHGFHCDQRPAYNEAAAKDGWSRALAWFDAHLART
jgi:carboxymethylenebutenolidase